MITDSSSASGDLLVVGYMTLVILFKSKSKSKSKSGKNPLYFFSKENCLKRLKKRETGHAKKRETDCTG